LCEALDFDVEENYEFFQEVKRFLKFEQKSNIQTISTKEWEKNEEQAEKLLAKRSKLKRNPTFLTCLVLFKDIFPEIKNSKSIFDLQ